MKMSNKRLEEIIKEEIKLFTQEKKLEEEDYPEMDTTPGSEYEKASARRREEIGGGLFGGLKQARFDATKKAREAGAGFGKLANVFKEDDTGESLEQRKAKFTKQARAQAATVGEASGDVDRDHAAMKIKIRKGSKDV
tara:strand:+ start:184 stop:597 length:414 start_codon:yes stop_codon:yes gene_type:complete